jgi:predicted acetyltransferase
MAVADHGDGAPGALNLSALEEAQRWITARDVDVILLLRDGQPAGFSLVRRESPSSRSVAEYYVEPDQRGRGVGRSAAMLLFDRFGGEWHTAALQRHPSAVRFWRGTVRSNTSGRHQETLVDGEVRQRFFARAGLAPDFGAVGATPDGRSSGAR